MEDCQVKAAGDGKCFSGKEIAVSLFLKYA
jgi:hypothetical protein